MCMYLKRFTSTTVSTVGSAKNYVSFNSTRNRNLNMTGVHRSTTIVYENYV